MSKLIYFDNNATTMTAPEVLEAMMPFFVQRYGNPSSMYPFGGEVAAEIKKAREKVAALLGCEPREVVFTSCGTESDNTAIWSALRTQPERRHFVTSRVEHPAIMSNVPLLRKLGYRVTEVGVDDKGNLIWDQFIEALTPDTALASFLWANNETGVIFPIAEMAEACAERGIPFHTDAVQVAGKIPIDVSKTKIDMLAISGHKLHAPKGIGVHYVRRGLKFSPYMVGGHQESGRRGGTENVPYIIGLGRAAELAMANMEDENTRVRDLRDRLEAGLAGAIPYTRVNGDQSRRVPNTTNISFEYIEGEAILLHLAAAGICASSGSACTSGSLEPSHVLRAMGVPFTAAHGSIRLSLSVHNTAEEVDYVIKTFPPIIAKLREMSPFWDGDGPARDNAMLTCETGSCQVCGV
ncbi:cysteine desulfurase NifS [Deltaproteobacteria bacterium OttesenSCG-928-M10]|nr:cysteine desulfurase NifS [Deltaproteobacteria bacterium OttesenSCG-928-M10]